MNKTVFLYAVSALSIIALASAYPTLAKSIVGIMILGLLAMHGPEYAALLTATTAPPKKGEAK